MKKRYILATEIILFIILLALTIGNPLLLVILNEGQTSQYALFAEKVWSTIFFWKYFVYKSPIWGLFIGFFVAMAFIQLPLFSLKSGISKEYKWFHVQLFLLTCILFFVSFVSLWFFASAVARI